MCRWQIFSACLLHLVTHLCGSYKNHDLTLPKYSILNKFEIFHRHLQVFHNLLQKVIIQAINGRYSVSSILKQWPNSALYELTPFSCHSPSHAFSCIMTAHIIHCLKIDEHLHSHIYILTWWNRSCSTTKDLWWLFFLISLTKAAIHRWCKTHIWIFVP